MIILPYHVDVPMARWPIANWAIMGLTTLLSFDAFSSINGEDSLQRWMLSGSGDWWSDAGMLGSTLTHGDIIHLLGNMIFLFVFGNAINAKLGHALFITSYFLLGIVSAMVYAAASADGTPSLGASGAISGITGMFMVLYPKNDVSVFVGFWFFLRPWGKTFHISAWVVIGAYFAKDLLFQIIFQSLGVETGVALMAHLSGTGAGFLLAAALLLTRRIPRDRFEVTLVDLVRARMA